MKSSLLSILFGVALVIAMAILQAFSWPTALVAAVGPLLVVVGTIYGITPGATAALIHARLSPHLVALFTAVLTALAGLLPLVSVGSLLRIIVGIVIAVGAVLLPGSAIPAVASGPAPAAPAGGVPSA